MQPKLAGSARWPAVDLRSALLAAVTGEAIVLAAITATERPHAVLVGGVALVIVVIALLRTDVAILLVVASAPVELAVTTTIHGLTLTKIAGALCFASFALHALRSRRILYVDRSQALVLVILAMAMLSTLQARETGAALTTTARYASFAAFFLVVNQFVRDQRLQRQIAWVLSVATTVVAVIALTKYFRSEVFVATPLDDSNPNDFAFILGTTLPFTFWLLASRSFLRPLVVVMIGVMSATTVLTLSRGGMLGIAAGILFLLITDRRRLRIVAVGGTIVIVAAVLVIRTDPAKFQRALFRKEVVASHNVTTRLEAWNAAANLAADHPLLGVGPGNFRFYYYEATGTPPGTQLLSVVHDAYLDVAAELGFVAAFAFLLYLALSFTRLTAATRAGVGPPGYAQAVRVSLVIGMVAAVFISEQYFLPFWLLGGLATALWHEVESAPAPQLQPA